jgi:RsiW-degrading membrane proteinase PrsW (M82 family)
VFDPRAVIEGRAPGRTSVAFIAGIVVTAACAIVALGIDATQSVAAGDGVVPFLIALPLALLPVPLLVAIVLFLDRLEPEPRAALVFAFAWGAGIAALFALIVNTAGLEYVTQPALGAGTGEYVSATFGAPVVEETLKGLVLIGLLWRRRAELDGPTDGVIYAAMVGLGFAMMENVGYYINALITPEQGGIALLGYTFVLRGVLSPLLHPIFTSMTGLGVAYAASRPRAGWWPVAAGWLAAMLLHGIWNGLSVYGAAGLVAGYLIMLCVLGGIVAVLVADRRRVVGLIRHYLPAYTATGLVTADDITMLASLRLRHRARNWARATGGLPAAAAIGDYQLAATELALLHDKADRGVVTPAMFERRQHDLLGLMHVARKAFLSRQSAPAPPPAPWAPSHGSGIARDTVRPAPLPPHPRHASRRLRPAAFGQKSPSELSRTYAWRLPARNFRTARRSQNWAVSELPEPDSCHRVIGSLVQDEGGPGAGGLDVLDEVDFVNGLPDLGAERVDIRGADLGKPPERGLRVGERGLPERVQSAEEPFLYVACPRVDIDGEVEEVGEREGTGRGRLQHVEAFEDKDIGPLHGLPSPGKDVVGQM